MRPRFTIGAKLAVLNGVVFGVAMLALIGFGLVAVDSVLLASADRVVDEELEEIINDLAGVPRSPEAIAAVLANETASDLGRFTVFYRVVEASGATIAASDEIPWPADALRGTVRIPGDENRYLAASRTAATPALGAIRIDAMLRLRVEDQAMAALMERAALGAPIALALSIALGILLARRSLRPIAAIDRAARGIGTEPGPGRLPRTGTGDELDRLAGTLNGMLDRLEEAAARNLRFAGDVAHEVRTPLATARSRLEGARDMDGALAPAIREQLDAGLGELMRLEAMVRNLLLIARADEGATPLASLDVVPVVREAVDYFRPLAEQKGVALEAVLPPSAELRGEPTSLSRAVANLLDNAIRYTDTGGKIIARVDAGPAGVGIEVRDDGRGIPEELRGRMFGRFVRAHDVASRNPDGSGLGLALVRAIARAHGGEATYAPGPGGGSVFRLELPRRAGGGA